MMTYKNGEFIPKLIDFGLSQHVRPGQKLTDSIGTIGYCAPEIVLGKPYGFEVDLWGLGVILYRIICGNLPFEDADK